MKRRKEMNKVFKSEKAYKIKVQSTPAGEAAWDCYSKYHLLWDLERRVAASPGSTCFLLEEEPLRKATNGL